MPELQEQKRALLLYSYHFAGKYYSVSSEQPLTTARTLLWIPLADIKGASILGGE